MRIPNLIPQLLMPREDLFFGLLRNSCRNRHEVTIKLLDMLEHYEDIEAKAREIKRLEEVGDHLIHEIMKNLHRTFVTPFDREDIAHLGERLDDVVDAVEEVARESANLMPPILDAVRAYATVGEIADVMRNVFGEHEEVTSL